MNDFQGFETSYFAIIIRLCLSAFLIPSAIGKIWNINAFIQGVFEYKLLNRYLSRIFGAVLPWIELTLAVMLISGIYLPYAGFVGSGLFLAFIIAITLNLKRGRIILCGCFGMNGNKNISWGAVVRNVILLLFCITLVYNDLYVSWTYELQDIFLNPVLFLVIFSFTFLCILIITLIEQTVDSAVRTAYLTMHRDT